MYKTYACHDARPTSIAEAILQNNKERELRGIWGEKKQPNF